MSAIASTDPLQAAQEAIFFYLSATEYLSDVIVLLMRKQNLENELQRALGVLATSKDGRRPGACLVVMMPTCDVQDENVPGPQLEATFTVRVMENPTLNMSDSGTGKSAESLALYVLSALHLLNISAQLSALYGSTTAVRPAEVEHAVAYDVQVKTRVGQNPLARCASVSLTYGTGTVTATCSISGAEIWFTTDGAYPARAGFGGLTTSAEQYSTPIPYTAGTIRAVAYAVGYLPSDIAEYPY